MAPERLIKELYQKKKQNKTWIIRDIIYVSIIKVFTLLVLLVSLY